MPEIPSIQPPLLIGTTKFAASEVASARVNGDVPVMAIAKSITGSTLSVVYPVPAGVGEAVTRVELLDKDGAVLTDSAVYIPLLSETWIKHTIPVKEGAASDGG